MAIIKEEITNTKLIQLLAPTRVNANNYDMPSVNTAGFGSVLFSVQVGESGALLNNLTNLQIKLSHSDNNVNFEPCEEKYVISSNGLRSPAGIVANINAQNAANTGYSAAYIGPKCYVKPVITTQGNLGEGVGISISAILQNPRTKPVSTQEIAQGEGQVAVGQIAQGLHPQEVQQIAQGQGAQQPAQGAQILQQQPQQIPQPQEQVIIAEDLGQPQGQ